MAGQYVFHRRPVFDMTFMDSGEEVASCDGGLQVCTFISPSYRQLWNIETYRALRVYDFRSPLVAISKPRHHGLIALLQDGSMKWVPAFSSHV